MEILEDSRIAKILDLIVIVLLVIIMGLLIKDVFFEDDCECGSTNTLVDDNDSETMVDETEEKIMELKNYKIDIKGAVKNPGVYQVSEETIINDAIKLAGGLKSNASTKYINLSKKVSDEMVLIIYTNSEVNKMHNPTNKICESNGVDITNCDGSSVIVSDNNSNVNKDNNSTSPDEKSKISINNATKEQLMTLNGIGESKALAIIEYRTKNNGFKALEELMNVSGIGELAYNKIKDSIML